MFGKTLRAFIRLYRYSNKEFIRILMIRIRIIYIYIYINDIVVFTRSVKMISA